MSTDIIQSIRNDLALAQGDLDEDTLAVAGSGNASRRISIEGGVFRKIVNGKEVGTIEDRYMNVIFVKLAHTPTRMYYDQTYKKGVKISPKCWSSDTNAPDADVEQPMAKTCAECPMSAKNSSPTGQGTACRLSWRTAVVLPNDPGGDVMQLVIPAASCFGKEESGRWPFRPYVQMLASNNISVGRVITKMQFDTNSSSPKLLFSPSGVVPVDAVPVVKQQAATPAAANAVKLTIFKPKEGAEGEAAAPAEAAPTPTKAESAEEPKPRVRDSKKAETPANPDLSSVMEKWAKK